MADDIELLGLELARSVRFTQEELLKKRELVIELTKTKRCLQNEVEDLSGQLKQCRSEVQEVKAQLRLRSEATLRLEQENTNLRDAVAKLTVQVETSSVERDHLIQRWQLAENERINLKTKCEQLEDEASESSAYKQQCLLLQNQLRQTVNKIVAQQELVQKEYTKVERAAQDSVAFAKTVSSHSKQQEAEAKQLVNTLEQTEDTILKLSAALADVRRERDVLVASHRNPKHIAEPTGYFMEWSQYQEEMKKRVEDLMGINRRLEEELGLVREVADSAVCPVCKAKSD